MNPRDIFQVLLRVLGVWLLFLGVRGLCGSVYYTIKVGFTADIVGDFLVSAMPSILVGLYLLSGANWLVRRCYGASDVS